DPNLTGVDVRLTLQGIHRSTDISHRCSQRFWGGTFQRAADRQMKEEGRDALALQVIGDLAILIVCASLRAVATQERGGHGEAAGRDDEERGPLHPRAVLEGYWSFHPARVLSRVYWPPIRRGSKQITRHTILLVERGRAARRFL